jgi:hypothetical protein
LEFAAKTRAPRLRIENVSRSQFTHKVTNIYSTIFGLNHVQDTPVGDAAIRGISGGEKKRVSYVSFHLVFYLFFDATSIELVKLWLPEV